MKKLAFTMIFMVVMAGTTAFADNSKAIGSWKIQVPDAPYEYSTSTITISESAGKLAVKLVFSSGMSANANSVTFVNDELKFSVSIEGYDIPFKGKIAGNVITGTVASPEGTLSVKGEKITFTGSWDYSAPDAPYEYSAGKIVFTEANGKNSAKVILGSGSTVNVTNLKIENSTFSFTVEIEYETVKVTGKLVNGKITGKADSSQGLINLTASRSKVQK